MESGLFPDNLKIAAICQSVRMKAQKFSPNNYRSISVLSIVAQLSEKVIHNKLYDYIKVRIYKYQSGFHSKHSTETAALNASNIWFVDIYQGKYNLVGI